MAKRPLCPDISSLMKRGSDISCGPEARAQEACSRARSPSLPKRKVKRVRREEEEQDGAPRPHGIIGGV